MKQRPQTEKRSTSKKPDTAVVYIIGESPLVEEYANLCVAKGFSVFVCWNSPSGTVPASGAVYKRTASVPANAALALELTNTDIEAKKSNLQKLDKALPPTAAIISSSITVTASEQATWIAKKHRLVGCGALPGLSEKSLVEIAPTVFSPAETVEVVTRFFRSFGKDIELVQDRVGLVLPRILCQIMNEAAFALQEDVASPGDIDTAMKLGVNYPFGPIEWADKIGFGHVCAVLSALERDLGEDRYRVAPLLKQMAQTGEWWKRS